METPEAKILEGPLCLLASHNALIGLFYFFVNTLTLNYTNNKQVNSAYVAIDLETT